MTVLDASIENKLDQINARIASAEQQFQSSAADINNQLQALSTDLDRIDSSHGDNTLTDRNETMMAVSALQKEIDALISRQ